MDRPNLLYIHSDQHNPYVTGCYGDRLVETPALDALAARGVLLEDVYSPSPVCVPSRMSMLTGRYPHEIEVWTNAHILDSAVPTLAHAMGAAGYRPTLIGRMHSIGPDQLHGYAQRLVGDHGPNYPGGVAVDHGILNGTAGASRASLLKSGSGQSAYQVHDEEVTAATVAVLHRLGVEKRASILKGPFCISVGFMLPHPPFVARAEDFDRFCDRIGLPKTPQPITDDLHPYFRWWRQQCGIENVGESEVRRARAAYWALVSRMDVMIGEILEALRSSGLDEKTLIVYASDHGESVGEHGLWGKRTFYEESVKAPAILSWPGRLPEGLRIDRVISSLDINATILEALEAPALPISRGRSLLPLIEDSGAEWEDEAFSEYCTDEGCLHRMVRSGPWKLCYHHGQPPLLFNLDEDPREVNDRSDDPGCRATLETLVEKVLEGWEPVEIRRKMAEKREDLKLLSQWTKKVEPADTFRWELRPEMNWLD